MKILLQNQYDDSVGGVETYYKLVTEALMEKGHKVISVYTKSGKKNDVHKENHDVYYLPDLDPEENVYFSNVRQAEMKKDTDTLNAIVSRERPDIIHLNNTHYPGQYSFLKRYAPVIQTVHDFFHCCNIVVKMLPEDVCTYPLGRMCFQKKCVSPVSVMELSRFKTRYLNQEAMKRFDKLLVTTPYMKEMLVCNGFSGEQIEALPLFVEDRITNGAVSGNVILFVGRLAREKGAIHFLHMLKKLTSDYKAFIIGDGPQREECEYLLNALQIRRNVEFTGFLNRDEIRKYYSKASVVVVPSLWPEPFCLVGLEAMSYSKPVIAYDVGGINTWLRDNYNGYLVPRGDIKGLAQRTELLLRNKRSADIFGKNGRRAFEKRFTKQVHVGRLIDSYNALRENCERAKHGLFKVTFPAVDHLRKMSDPASPHNILRKYPNRRFRESLPEYNKRVISYEIRNKICSVRSYPEEITIATTTRCNMKPPCVMCEKNLRLNEKEYDIDAGVFRRLKSVFKHADRIYLHCGGEPLMTKRSYEIIESVQPPTKIVFNTNGVLFTEKTIKYMVDSQVVDVISFSMDSATEETYKKIRSAKHSRVINNIKTLLAYRNQVNKDKPLLRPVVIINFVIFKMNVKEVPDYVLLAKELGVDGIDFSHLNAGFDWRQRRGDYVFDYKKESVLNMEDIEEHDRLVARAYELGKKHEIPINFNGNPFIGKTDDKKAFIKNEISEVLRDKKVCFAPWRRAVIEIDGRIRMCYFHESAHGAIGKLKDNQEAPAAVYYRQHETFEDAWNSEEAVMVRKEFLENGIAERCVTDNPCIFQERI